MKLNSILPRLFLAFLTLAHASSLVIERDIVTGLVDRSASPDPVPIPTFVIPPGDGGAIVPTCWSTLSCSYAQIQSVCMPTRLSFVRYVEASHFPALNCNNQFRPVEGVIELFIAKGIGKPRSWVSCVNAGILEGVKRGGAITLGYSTATGGNPRSQMWVNFMKQMQEGQLGMRNMSIIHDLDVGLRILDDF